MSGILPLSATKSVPNLEQCDYTVGPEQNLNSAHTASYDPCSTSVAFKTPTFAADCTTSSAATAAASGRGKVTEASNRKTSLKQRREACRCRGVCRCRRRSREQRSAMARRVLSVLEEGSGNVAALLANALLSVRASISPLAAARILRSVTPHEGLAHLPPASGLDVPQPVKTD